MALLAGAPAALAQPACTTTGSATTCSVPAGGAQQEVISNQTGVTLTITGTGNISTTTSPFGLYFQDSGIDQGPGKLTLPNNNNYVSASGTTPGGLDVTTASGVSVLVATPAGLTQRVEGLQALSIGGNGGPGYPGDNSPSTGGGGNGGDAAGVTVTNGASITIQQGGGQAVGGATALDAESLGGNGGNATSSGTQNGGVNDQYNKGANGGNGANGGAVNLTNSGDISIGQSSGGQTIPLTGDTGARGISGVSTGGNGGTGRSGPITSGSNSDFGPTGAIGGDAGNVTVVNSGAVSVLWQWAGTQATSDGVFGVVADTQGGNGAPKSEESQVNGGAAGLGGQFSLTQTNGAVSVTASGTLPSAGAGLLYTPPGLGLSTNLQGAAVAAISQGGLGGIAFDTSTGGAGGQAGTYGISTVTLSNAALRTSGTGLAGVVGETLGGAGGAGGYEQDHSNGGAGGATGAVTVGLSGGSVATTGVSAPDIVVVSKGGVGGAGTDFSDIGSGSGGAGGAGGHADVATVTLSGTSVASTGDQSAGIVALSMGGNGGNGGGYTGTFEEGGQGTGGDGGYSAAVNVTLSQKAQITLSGSADIGIAAVSAGGFGGQAGNLGTTGASGINGGNGGASGNVTVTVNLGSSITTSGNDAIGILAQSLSGGGGAGSNGIYFFGGSDGGGGTSGNTGTVSVTNGGAIATSGEAAYGILAQTTAGAGGAGGAGFGTFYSGSGNGAVSGAVGTVTVDNTGTISTTGQGAYGILAQANGGNGGAGGSSGGGLIGLGGTGGSASDGGGVTVTANGTISTQGTSSLGILAQSVGGGGGASGTSIEILNVGGGSGGGGGKGGDVTLTMQDTKLSTAGNVSIAALAQSIGGGGGSAGDVLSALSIGGSGGGGGDGGTADVTATGANIMTMGDEAHGLVAQSVGGGGGAGGTAGSLGSIFALAIGGGGGVAGNGNTASVTATNTTVSLYGSNADGLVAQSVGGGGGIGGGGHAVTANFGFSASVGIGGSGGGGGGGGAASITTTNTTITTGLGVLNAENPANVAPGSTLVVLPVDAFGVVAQSIGGGGGTAGSASAKAYVANIPIPETGTSLGASATFAVGGSGGTASSGGTATVTLTNGTDITTNGQGSDAVFAQSVGGGGGAGGDSSAAGATYGLQDVTGRAVFSINVSATLGGSGGGGGSGGETEVYVGGTVNGADANGSAPVRLRTNGDYADAIFAQSVGGGGGNAGFGSSATDAVGGTTGTLGINASVGADGGAGSNGGKVGVTIYPEATITTYGSSAYGVLAQSVGGGGGSSAGGSYEVAGSVSAGGGLNGSVGVNAGGTGVSGGTGGQVTVTLSGTINTRGDDASGILAQSVGGGGGLAGSAGTDASADNPINPNTGQRSFPTPGNDAPPSTYPTLGLNLSFGATGGSGGVGGDVAVNLSNATIDTTGDWSRAVIAQSVGGGGGIGGAAGAGLPSNTLNVDVQANFALGGKGGIGGNGGKVDLTLASAKLQTRGFWADGVLAQSIGGGGGIAGSGSQNSTGGLTLGGTSTRSGGGGGLGGDITFTSSGHTSIATAGEGAMGIVLQSIGGGGGLAGSGSQFALGAAIPNITLGFSISAGGGTGSSGSGGSVTMTGPIGIATVGNNAYGVLAQSIGGGGGLVGLQIGNQVNSATVGGEVANNGSYGGAVQLTLGPGSTIATSGIGSDAILAQSIGGGGGIAGFAAGTPDLNRSGPGAYVTYGNGGAVTINTGGSKIMTTGAGADGIFAQSIGAGGGIETGANSAGQVLAGSTGAAGSYGVGGLVTITQGGTLIASGANAIGIYAQSVGTGGSSAGSTITVNGTVQGGSGTQGWGIWVDSDNTTNTVQINSSGSVSAASGQAIVSTGFGITNVTNSGTLSGSVDLASGNSTPGTLTNNGTVTANAAGGFNVATIVGRFVQTNAGEILANADFNNRKSSKLIVDGTTSLGGTVRLATLSVLPNISLPVLQVDGQITGSLAVRPTSLFTYALTETSGVQQGAALNVSQNAVPVTEFSVSAIAADFAASRFGLTQEERAVASHLQHIWDVGATPAFGTLFEALDTLANNNAGYGPALRSLSPAGALAPLSHRALDIIAVGTSMFGCEDVAGTTVSLDDRSCAWLRSGDRQISLGGEYASGLNTFTTQVGGQAEFAPGWFVGGTAGYETNWLLSSNKATKAQGDAAFAGLSLQYQTGPWQFGIAVSGLTGSSSTSRYIGIPGFQSTATASPSASAAGIHARAAYTFGEDEFYIRPSLSVDGVLLRADPYTESGAGTLNQAVSGDTQTSVAGTPLVEIGRRLTFDSGLTLRGFVSAGLSVLSIDSFKVNSRFAIAPQDAAGYTATIPIGNVFGRVGAGVQLTTPGRLDVRLQYDREFSGNVTSNAGSLTGVLKF
jgi:hypothetical protein